MLKNKSITNKLLSDVIEDVNFSGVVFAKTEMEIAFQSARGHSNRADELLNNLNTRFGIASGCKLFTAIGICQLVEEGILTFDTRLKEIMGDIFPHFDKDITVHHLLTHTSGVPDYFDEEIMDDFEELWKERPMYHLNQLRDFLPLFQNNKMMFKPGERFHYNNAGFILLGLIIEKRTGLNFQDYVQLNIFEPCGMKDSGYFRFDNLPKNTAIGYIDNEEDGTWRTNIYSLPIRGGSDGGAYVTAQDMTFLWDGLRTYKLLSKEYTEKLLTPHVIVKDVKYYGYGIWISKRNDSIFKYHVMGYDPGVSFHSAYYPASGLTLVIPSNKSFGPSAIMETFENHI
ncbi:CubicO group peptidase (beta-lactamase class C family) [Cytobacillus oceanisediminis]|jgi:CubicO group peptidase (beta-lactamase class C family)|uniref:CubicO group peptidase (Beta-lactamase class C family) n=1 Tax=Cytobacillus oceanisediminis TaxID=665099 RepID=A0A2V2ZV00_9BACI|nr:serine hydrolase [Cytobacillus oceanisediminis]PWW28228.1 CubicO group peptidase (beta-lactamase class C family) [Cytobacillus oceanisediminis]